MIQVNRIYLIFNRLVTKKFLVDTSDSLYAMTATGEICTADKVSIAIENI